MDFLPEDSPLLNGQYYDFLAEWYGVVGVSIAVSCLINAITPLFNFGFKVAYGLLRCIDRGCTADMTKTKKILQDDYEKSYTGPSFQIGNRYAQLIAMTCIVLMYSVAIPILYVAGFFICVTMYWSDKVLFLRHYRLPPRYGLNLAGQSRIIMEYAIVLHLFTGLYMLSNPQIFPSGEDKTEYEGGFTSLFGSLVHTLFGTDKSRFS